MKKKRRREKRGMKKEEEKEKFHKELTLVRKNYSMKKGMTLDEISMYLVFKNNRQIKL